MFNNLIAKIAGIGSEASDTEDVRLQKALLVICAFPFMLAGLLWGIIYILFGETIPGLIPICYALISLASIFYFKQTHRFDIFRFSQLLLILLLPCAVMISLGGFINGSVVILWGLISPLGAMLFDTPKNAPRWFIAYILLVILIGVFQPLIAFDNNLTLNQRNFFFVISVIGVGSLIFLMVYYFVNKKNYFQERSEALLLNILPKEIADILRNETRTIANQFENASILFADVVDFTPMVATMTPASTVELLNEIFSRFDDISDKYQLEKIKTIGDCYMVASGIPRSRADHAQALVEMAVEMRDYVESNMFLGRKIQFRFGINSGPVVAGVIGRKKFIYDLWGDAVNIASRMESHGAIGSILITQHTYELIKEYFDCDFYGTTEVKGKGAMEVWLVKNIKKPVVV